MADIQSNIQVNIDTTQALASIKNLQRQISAFHSSMAKGGAAANAVSAQMQQTLINSINATGKFSAQIRSIRTTTESFTDSLEKNKFSLGEYFRYAGGASKTFGRLFKTEFDTINKVARENVKDLQTQYISLGRDASGAMKSIAVRPLALDMTDLGTRTQIAAQKQAILNQLLKQGSTNLLNFGKNTQWAGRQLMVGFTLPLIAVGSAASKTFMDMEAQAIRFKKVYGDLFTPNAESQQALKDIQELGKEFTKYGIAVSTTVGLAAEAAAAGFKGVDLQRQTAAATRLSILGQVESQKALETTIALQNAFSMSSENLAESIDFLNAVENQTVLSLDDISTAIPKAAPVVQQLGGDVKDLAFLMTAMKEGGINASEGANALKSGLASLINPTGKANEMLLAFGINAKKIVLDNKGDLKKTVVEFATALNQLDPLNRAQAIEQMFGKFQFARLSTLFANVTKEGTQASRVLDLAGASVQELAGLAEKELGMTSESAMNKFKGAIEDLKVSLIPLGEQFLKAVTPIAQFLTKVLDKFNGFSDNTKKIIVVLTGIVAGLGPVLLMTVGLVMNGLANMIKLFAFLKSAFNKTGQSTATLGTEVKYMTTEQRNAAAVAASLDQVHVKLAQTFTSEATAVNALTRAYQRAIAAQSQFVPVAPPLTRGPIKKFATGKPATVGGTGNKDSELALLMPGETVIPTAMSKKYGGIINAMIADRIPGYDDGKPKTGSPSLYGGQSLQYSGLGVFAPGNTSSSTFGMDRSFLMEGDSFLKSLTATSVGGGATLDDPAAKLTRAKTAQYHEAVKTFVPRIVDVLRSTVSEMEKNGENIDSIEDVTRRAKPKLDKIFGEMTAQGGKAASSATALRKHLFFPGQAEMGGQFGETRVPGARRSSSGRIKDTMYRIKGSPFQSRVKTAYRHLFGSNPEGSYAHMNESRMLGPEVPLRGGALTLPASEQATLAARVRAKARQIRTDFAGGQISKRRSSAEKAAIRQSGADDKREYVRGAESVDGKDPYIQTRDRKSPHAQAAKDGRDDARSYTTARDKELTQAGRRRRVATRPQGPAPIGATPQPGMRILPIVPPNPKGPTPIDPDGPNPTVPTTTSQTRGQMLADKARGVGGRLNTFGGGMGLLGVNMGLSMVPDFAGKGIIQGGLAGANLGQMFGPYGMAIGATIGTVTSAVSALIGKYKELQDITKATFTSSADVATFFGNRVVDTTLKVGAFSTSITGLAGATDKLGQSFGYTNEELAAFTTLIESLPEDNAMKEVVDKMSDESDPAKILDLARTFLTTQIAVGQMTTDQGQKMLDIILSYSGHLSMVGTSFLNISSQTQAVSMHLRAAATNSTVLGDALLQLLGAASDTSDLETVRGIIEGIGLAGLNSKRAIDELAAALLRVKAPKDYTDAIKVIRSIDGINEAQVIELMDAATRGANIDTVGKTLEEILEKARKDVDEIAKGQQEVSGNVQTKAYQEIEKQTAASKKQIDILKKKKKIIDDELKKQEKISNELKRQNDYIDKQADLDKKIVEAKISGDYIGAANLLQAKTQNTAEFNAETEKSNLQAKSDALQAQIDALQLKNDELVSAINKSANDQIDATETSTDKIVKAITLGKVTGEIDKEFRDPISDKAESSGVAGITKGGDKPGSTKKYYDSAGNEITKDLYEDLPVGAPSGKDGTLAEFKVPIIALSGKTFASRAALTRQFFKENNGRGSIKTADGFTYYATGQVRGPDKTIVGSWFANKPGSTEVAAYRDGSIGGVKGPGTGTSDSIPAYLSNGEYVIKAKSVRKYGTETFDALNAGKFAEGGLAQRFKNGVPAFGNGGPAWLKRLKTMKAFGFSGALYQAMEEGEKWLSLKHGANENSSGFHKWSKAIARTLYNVPQGAVAGLPFGYPGLIGGAIAGGLEGLEGLRRDGSQYGVKGGSRSTEKGFNANKELKNMTLQGSAVNAITAGGIGAILGPLINLLPKGIQKTITTKLGQNVVSSALIGMAPFNPTMGFSTPVKPTTSITQKFGGSKPGSAVEQRISGMGSQTFAGSINTIENQIPVARTSEEVSAALVSDMFASAIRVAEASGRLAPNFLGRSMTAREGTAQFETYQELDPLLDDITNWQWESNKPSSSPIVNVPTIIDKLSLKQRRMIAFLAGKKSSLVGVPTVTQKELNSGYNWYYEKYGDKALDWDTFKAQQLASVGLRNPVDKKLIGYTSDTRAFEELHAEDFLTSAPGERAKYKKFTVGGQRQSDEFDRIYGPNNMVRYETPLMDDTDFGKALRIKFKKVYDELIRTGYIRKAWYDAKGIRHEQKDTAPLPDLPGMGGFSVRGKALTPYEFYKAVAATLPDGTTSSRQASANQKAGSNYLDRPTDFVRTVNEIYAQQHGVAPGEKITFWKYDLYGSPLKNDKGEPVAAGYYSLDKEMAYAYARGRGNNPSQEELDSGSASVFMGAGPEAAKSRGAYSIELYPHEIPQVIGLGGLKDEMAIVIGERLAKEKSVFTGMAKASEYQYDAGVGAIRGLSPWKMYAPGEPWTVESPNAVFGVPQEDSAKMADLLNSGRLSLRLGGKREWTQEAVSQVLKAGAPYVTKSGTTRFVAQDAIPKYWGSGAEEVLERMLQAQEMYNLIRVNIQNLPKVELLKTLSKEVPKLANGGLIRGPGTGVSDSIRASLGYAGGGSIRVSNGEYIVKAKSVRDYGVKTMDAINNGTARVGTESGGTVYNISMPVTSNNANPEIVANEVMRKLKLEISKNNKTNKVGG